MADAIPKWKRTNGDFGGVEFPTYELELPSTIGVDFLFKIKGERQDDYPHETLWSAELSLGGSLVRVLREIGTFDGFESARIACVTILFEWVEMLQQVLRDGLATLPEKENDERKYDDA